ncbi:MAG: nucleoside hydrolase [Oscillospiraceae bacterium]|nr:nucleoside hydrolase [Oscillospiraceae bacterium]
MKFFIDICGTKDSLIAVSAAANAGEVIGVSVNASRYDIDIALERVKDYLGDKEIECPVFIGATKPVCGEEFVISGSTVLKPELEEIHDLIMKQDEKVIFIGTSTYSDVALLLSLYPDTSDNICEFIFSNGAIRYGDAGHAEVAVLSDVDAANIFYTLGRHYVLIPYDVADEMNLVSWAVHTVVYAVHPEYYDARPATVEIDLCGGQTYGCTICDVREHLWQDIKRTGLVVLGAKDKKLVGKTSAELLA